MQLERVDIAVRYPAPIAWDHDSASSEVLACPSTGELIQVMCGLGAGTQPASAFRVLFHCTEWLDRLAADVMAIPASVRGEFRLNGISIIVGPFTMPTADECSSLGPFPFGVDISGYDYPDDLDGLAAAFFRLPRVAEVMDRLQQASSVRFLTHIYAL